LIFNRWAVAIVSVLQIGMWIAAYSLIPRRSMWLGPLRPFFARSASVASAFVVIVAFTLLVWRVVGF
jgi:hypothetical protein